MGSVPYHLIGLSMTLGFVPWPLGAFAGSMPATWRIFGCFPALGMSRGRTATAVVSDPFALLLAVPQWDKLSVRTSTAATREWAVYRLMSFDRPPCARPVQPGISALGLSVWAKFEIEGQA